MLPYTGSARPARPDPEHDLRLRSSKRGIDLLFVDERKSGSTQYVSAVKLQDLAGTSSKKPGASAARWWHGSARSRRGNISIKP